MRQATKKRMAIKNLPTRRNSTKISAALSAAFQLLPSFPPTWLKSNITSLTEVVFQQCRGKFAFQAFPFSFLLISFFWLVKKYLSGVETTQFQSWKFGLFLAAFVIFTSVCECAPYAAENRNSSWKRRVLEFFVLMADQPAKQLFPKAMDLMDGIPPSWTVGCPCENCLTKEPDINGR